MTGRQGDTGVKGSHKSRDKKLEGHDKGRHKGEQGEEEDIGTAVVK